MPTKQIPQHWHPLSTKGFTLVELLVAIAVGSLVIIATTTVFAPQLRMHQKLEGLTRLQERWARINFLLDTEIQEAHTIAPIPNGLRLTICEPAPDFYTFSPRCADAPTGTGTPGTDIRIDYVWNPTNQTLSRTGAPITRDGQLDTASVSSTHPLTTGVYLFNSVISNESIAYTLSFRDPLDPRGSTYTGKTSAARARIKKL